MKRKLKAGAHYIIHWIDACGPTTDWEAFGRKNDVAHSETSGWVVKDDGRVVSIAGTRCVYNDNVTCIMFIPKGCIVKARRTK